MSRIIAVLGGLLVALTAATAEARDCGEDENREMIQIAYRVMLTDVAGAHHQLGSGFLLAMEGCPIATSVRKTLQIGNDQVIEMFESGLEVTPLVSGNVISARIRGQYGDPRANDGFAFDSDGTPINRVSAEGDENAEKREPVIAGKTRAGERYEVFMRALKVGLANPALPPTNWKDARRID